MARKSTTVAELARTAGLDVDETLIRLWDAGLSEPTSGSDLVHRSYLDEARKALGIPRQGSLRRVDHWLERLDVDRGALTDLLAESGISIGPQATKLPKHDPTDVKDPGTAEPRHLIS